jgi:phosphate transport system substrate-binding protein
VEDSLTSGRIRIACAPEARGLIAREADAFKALYPDASLEIQALPSRESVAALLGAKAELAITTREMTPDERAAAVHGKLEMEGYRFARDAVVLIVNSENKVENVALNEMRDVFSGSGASWSRFGGESQPIETVVQPSTSDLTECLSEAVLSGGPIRSPSRFAGNEAEAVREVQRNPRALGYVSLAATPTGVRVLRVASLTGLPYWKPDLEAVYRGDYPLTRMYSMYIRSDGPKLASGFITYVTSRDGQVLVQKSGLVPTAVPVRFVRRSPMLGDH